MRPSRSAASCMKSVCGRCTHLAGLEKQIPALNALQDKKDPRHLGGLNVRQANGRTQPEVHYVLANMTE